MSDPNGAKIRPWFSTVAFSNPGYDAQNLNFWRGLARSPPTNQDCRVLLGGNDSKKRNFQEISKVVFKRRVVLNFYGNEILFP